MSRCPFASELCHAKKSQAKKRRQKISSLKRREAERREAHHRAASQSDAARTLSPVLPLREDRGRAGPQKMERARSPFGAPPRHPRFWASARLRPRFLEPPDANGRTLSRTSAASTSQSARAERDDAQAARERSIGPRSTRTAPAPPSGVPSRKASLCERDVGYVTVMGTDVKGNVALLGTRRRAD